MIRNSGSPLVSHSESRLQRGIRGPRINATRQVLLGLLLLLGTATAAISQEGPELVVQHAAARLFSEVRGNKQKLRSDPVALHQLVSSIVLPHIDTDHVSELTLGRYWRDATQAQRQRFRQAFASMLVNTYGNALLAYEDEIIEWHPAVTVTGENAMVHSRVVRSDGPPIPVNYSLRLSDGRWRVYDVSVDAVSLVTNYRGSFVSAIRQNGLEGLIARLEGKGR